MFAIVDSTRGGSAWLIGSFTGWRSYDQYQRLLVNSGDALVFDQYDTDYGWSGQRFIFWLDLRRGITIASRELRRAPMVGWGRRGGSVVPMVQDASKWVEAGEVDLGEAVASLAAGRSTALDHPDTSWDRPGDATWDGVSRWVLAGDPVVLVEDGPSNPEQATTLGPGRLGHVVGHDTIWSVIPPAPVSLRDSAWTWYGIVHDYKFNEHFGGPVRYGDRVFAGISFMGGEGFNGVGGLVEYSISKRSLIVHRWQEIIRRSAGTPVIARDSMWLPLYHSGEYGTHGAGILVVDLASGTVKLAPFPDPVRRLERSGGVMLVDGGTSLGVLAGDQARRWVVVPDAGGRWTTLEALPQPLPPDE